MLKVGDTVKVIGKTLNGANEMVEIIPIGTIGKVITIENEKEEVIAEVVAVPHTFDDCGYWYKENELEKGKLVWVKED